MTSPPWRMATVDIDGTLTTEHGWLVMAREFGREADYHALMRRLRAGEIGEDETIAGLLEFAEGHSLTDVERVLGKTPKLANIPEGVRRLHEVGIVAALLTHNPAYVTEWYCRFGGFDDAAGLAGRQPVGLLIGRAQGARADKPGGLALLCRRHGVRPSEVVHVGDAPPDAVIFAEVGEGISVNARRPEVARAADIALRTTDFEEVVDAILGSGPRR
jgi:phosphoserine phosphatase